MLRFFFYAALLTGVIALPATAQPADPLTSVMPVTGDNRCSDLVNMTDFTVYGSARTDITPMADGTMAHHEAVFSIPPGEKWRLCSSGPFFDGGKIELKIRTLFPVFECLTQLGAPIAITATRKSDDTGYDWSAACR